MAFVQNEKEGLVYMSSSVIEARHCFTTRFGGVSEGIFATLNLGSNIGDPQSNVAENYRRVCALLGAGPDDCAVTKQIHGSTVRTITEADRHVCGAVVPYEADGLVTDIEGLPLFCFIADCTPVLLYDGVSRVAAAVHCGWRGSCADIIGNAVKAMTSLGSEPADIKAALGPAIGACCFETDSDVPRAIDGWIGPDSGTYIRRPDGKFLVDLRTANKIRLMQLGIPEENVDVSTECTFCSNEKYWSHRYTHGKRGVQCAGIVIR